MNNRIVWLLVGGYFAWAIIDPFFHPVSPGAAAGLRVLFMLGIAATHALRRYSLKQFLVFFAITFVISNAYENISVLTGFPFGHYHYTDVFGPKLFLVPLLIAPAYFGAGYFSWSLAHVLIGAVGRKMRSAEVLLLPLVAAFVMVMWDMQMDPISSTLQNKWIWHDGGSYFGVPFSNFMGWYLCVYTIYQLFAIYLWQQQRTSVTEVAPVESNRQYWYQMSLAYLSTSISWVAYALTGKDFTVTDAAGQQWQAMQVYESLALVALFTMWFVAFVSAIIVSNMKTDAAGRRVG